MVHTYLSKFFENQREGERRRTKEKIQIFCKVH
jgi:hypothetical protein